MHTVGIYQIIHRPSQMRYIGSSVDIPRRIDQHYEMLLNGEHHCWRLQEAWNRSGGSGWSADVIERCRADELAEREQFWIDAADVEDLLNTQLRVSRGPQVAGEQDASAGCSPLLWIALAGVLFYIIVMASS